MKKDPKARFTSRVENYVKYRPSYPPEVLRLLEVECGLNPECVIADVGSGTGILSEIFLRFGCKVYGVEPNLEMRRAGEKNLSEFSRYCSVNGSAEETTLPDHKIDFVTAGQSFHWFDRARAKTEFKRILTAGGWVVLIWNQRVCGRVPFLQEYEELLQTHAADYRVVDHRNVDLDMITRFYGDSGFRMMRFANYQDLDFDSLKGRLLSSSYTPEPGEHGYGPMITRLHEIFDTHQINGQVRMQYDTSIYFGKLNQ